MPTNGPAGDQIPTRKSLPGRLKNWEDQASWGVCFDTYWKLIDGFSIQRGLNHQEAQEVVQEATIRLAVELPAGP